MQAADRPQIYLMTPLEFELSAFPERLASVLDAFEIACLRLSLATRDEDRLSRAADALREISHSRDIAIVIDTHVTLADRLGLDGVHVSGGARAVRAARKVLGTDAIVGASCGTSRHEGMNAGEAGADYISFGPAGISLLGDGSRAETDLFAWWSEMIELPVVAEGHLDPDTVGTLALVTDFFAIGEEIWNADDPVTALATLLEPLR